ncbi:MAG TPA: nucleotidyltransferase family protein [Deinococcales bacterium]|nr:nucleotidyltransferase family protein [Deinococcales bacterium]
MALAPDGGILTPETIDFYRRTIRLLRDGGLDFLLGGAYAFAVHAGIERHTKDLDVMVRPQDAERALEIMAGAGYETRIVFPHWLGKAYCGDDFVDVIYSSGNGVGTIDDRWFRHARDAEMWGEPVRLVPPEEMIWHKAFVQERERFDGADINHLLRAQADRIDWPRLLDRFGPYWHVLLSHLVMFGFVYPGERHRIPSAVMHDLLERARAEAGEPGEPGICRGPIISRGQYLPDTLEWGLQDGRISGGHMTPEDVDTWTEAIGKDHG